MTLGRIDRKAGWIVRVRRRYLPLAAVAGAFLAMLPSVASSETSPTVEVVNTGPYTHYWTPTQVTVGVGGVVALRNTTTVAHGVEWVGGPARPECSSGIPVGTTAAASGEEWSGTCTFAQAGAYTFYCTVHGPEMTGTVTVSANGTTPTGTATTPTAGNVSFLVKLDAVARRALARHHKLMLVVRITFTPLYGSPSILTRTVVVHA